MIPKRSIQSDALEKERRDSMRIEKNVQVVKDFFAAMGSGDKQALTALVAEDY
jgi:hypothetical protein